MKAASYLVALLFLFGLLAARAEDIDGELNDAFKKLLTAAHSDPYGLKWLELHWIKYRDAEANLEAWIAGKTKRDESARAKCIQRMDRERIVDLNYMVKLGIFCDPSFASHRPNDANPAAPDQPSYLQRTQAYAALRKAVVAMQNPNLTSALIRSESEWLWFSELQSDGEGMKFDPRIPEAELTTRRKVCSAELERLRLEQLQNHATALGIDLRPMPLDAENGEAPMMDDSTATSPDASLRIEQIGAGKAWVISNKTGERSRLAEIQHGANEDTGKSDMSSGYAISPDNQWIFRTLKIYHGLDGAYLYERASLKKLDFKPATSEALDILAWKFFRKATKATAFDYSQGGVVNFVAWKPGVLRISLNAASRADVNNFLVDYNLKTKTFSVPPDLKAHDRNAIGKSK